MSRLPNFIIVGAQKSGTTAAARNLNLHPDVSVFSGVNSYGQWELEFFNEHWDRGVGWYSSYFVDDTRLIGEKTAELLHRTVCHQRMYSVNADLKLIVLLRSPIERAYSQWKMAALGKLDEPRNFDDVIAAELETLNDDSFREQFYNCASSSKSGWREGYILKGFYDEQLESLRRWFPAENVYIGVSERIRQDLSQGYREIFEFLGVGALDDAPFSDHFVSREAPPISSWTRDALRDVYRQSNQRLFTMLGKDIPEWR